MVLVYSRTVYLPCLSILCIIIFLWLLHLYERSFICIALFDGYCILGTLKVAQYVQKTCMIHTG